MPSPPNTVDELTDVELSGVNGHEVSTFHRTMTQEVELRAGGKPYPGRLDLVKFSVSVSTNNYYTAYESPPFAPDNPGALANTWPCTDLVGYQCVSLCHPRSNQRMLKPRQTPKME